MHNKRRLRILCLLFSFLLLIASSCEREGAQEDKRTDEGGPSQGAWTIDERSSDDDIDDDALPQEYGSDLGSGSMDPANPIAFNCSPNNLDAYELVISDTADLIDMNESDEVESGDDNPVRDEMAACAGYLLYQAVQCAVDKQDNSELLRCLQNARDRAVQCGYEPADVFDPHSLAKDIRRLRTEPQRMTCLKNAQADSTSCTDWNCLVETKTNIEDCLFR